MSKLKEKKVQKKEELRSLSTPPTRQTTKIIHYLMPSNALFAVALVGSIARILFQYSFEVA